MKIFSYNSFCVVPKMLVFDSISNDAKIWFMSLLLLQGVDFHIENAAANLGMTVEQAKAAHQELIEHGWIKTDFIGDILLMEKNRKV